MHNKEDQIKEILAGMRVPEGLSKSEAWEKLQARIQQEEQTPVVTLEPRTSTRWWAAAAVACGLAVGLFAALSGDDMTVIVADQPLTVTLPDGSTVTLNDGAQVAWNVDTWETERLVELEGEGFFEVEKGSDFEVRTGRGSVFVLGTSFNVNTDGCFEVDCFTGKVGVESPLGEVTLTPGECAVVREGQLVETTFQTTQHSWQAGKFAFTDAPLSQIASSLSKAYDVTIDASAVASETQSFDVEVDAMSLEDVFIVLDAFGYRTQKSGKTYRLVKK